MSRQINPEQDHSLLDLGRFIQETSYPRKKKDFTATGIKIDLIHSQEGKLIIGEIKKSSRYLKSATMQLAFYLYKLKEMGLTASGELLIPKEKKKIPISLDSKLEAELKTSLAEIEAIINVDSPPPPAPNRYCKRCAYQEFCFG